MSFALPLSPVHSLPVLALELGMRAEDLLVLREDLIGLDGGGNKVRKANLAVGRAAADGITTVITTGAPQSNHARATALCAARRGIDCVLVLEGDKPQGNAGNLLLESMAAAEIVWSGEADPGELATEVASGIEGRSRVIPFGGSDPSSVEVYAEVGARLAEEIPDLAQVVVALGSGATAAGLVRSLGADRVLSVDTGAVPDPEATLRRLLGPEATQGPLRIDRSQVGSGYEHVQPAVWDAVRRVLRTDGVLFDVTYAGRALSGLIDGLRTGSLRQDARTLLIHTGGVPGLFGHPELRAEKGSWSERPRET